MKIILLPILYALITFEKWQEKNTHILLSSAILFIKTKQLEPDLI